MRFEHDEEHELRREQPRPEAQGPGAGAGGALDLASAIGNHAMQRVAAAPGLQRAGAPLVGVGGARLQRREHEVLEEQETHENLGSPEGIEGNRLAAGTEKEPAGALAESHGREAGVEVEVEHREEEIGRVAGEEQVTDVTREERDRPKQPGEREELNLPAGEGLVEVDTTDDRD
jgi:hypothetical protein